jgi:UDP-galactopyranose mutase
LQSIRVTPLADVPLGTMTPRPHVGIASYDSVVNNQVGWDIGFHTRDKETWRGIPAYASANTSTNGVANYNNGTYVLMPIRIHIHKGRHGIHRSH